MSQSLLCILPLRLCDPVDETAFQQATNGAQLLPSQISLFQLRQQVHAALTQGHAKALAQIKIIQQYAAALKEVPDAPLNTVWFSPLTNLPTAFTSIQWERYNVLWNLIAIYAFQSTTDVQSFVSLQNAASLALHLKQTASKNAPCFDFSPQFLQLWQDTLLAQAQRSSYQTMIRRGGARPRHFICAQLAAAAVPLCDRAQSSWQETNEVATNNHNDSETLLTILDTWSLTLRAWHIYLSSMAEYHQAFKHATSDKEAPLQYARLQAAVRFAELAHNMLEPEDVIPETHELLALVQQALGQMQIEMPAHMQQEFDEELPPIRPQQTVNLQPIDSKILPTCEELNILVQMGQQATVSSSKSKSKTKPSSLTPTAAVDNPSLQHYRQAFLQQLFSLHRESVTLAHSKTESGRQALNTVHLPHSLTAYQQECQGSGIPEELWQRVAALQQERRVDALKQEIWWQLRDFAETAKSLFNNIQEQLQQDLAMDSAFREAHQDFTGHDVKEVQRDFREALQKFANFIKKAREGDEALLERCQSLETDPKFQLLKFQKSQLDRLMPNTSSSAAMNNMVDVSSLGKHLVELSHLFEKREAILKVIEQRIHEYKFDQEFRELVSSGVDPEQAFHTTVQQAKDAVQLYLDQVADSVERQSDLLRRILEENKEFMRARDVSRSENGDSCIVKIEDALDEIEEFSKHLSEGKAFYDVIIPKLQKLKMQVGEVSTRLAVERIEFEDRVATSRQEAEDARMAARFAEQQRSQDGGGHQEPSNQSSTNYRNPAGSPNVQRRERDREPAGQPGVEQVDHQQPMVRVDDSKVATLVAMDFDPDKVVAALRKYDNNLEQALNELCSG